MDTNRPLPARALAGACLASLMLVAPGLSAQTIYKQVDENGRVMFTDQPNAGARVITSYESGRGEAPRQEMRRMPAEVVQEASRPAPTIEREPMRPLREVPMRESDAGRFADSEAMPDTARRGEAEMPRRAAENPYAGWRRVTPSSPEITARRVETPAVAAAEPQRPAEPLPRMTTTIVSQAPAAAPQAAGPAPNPSLQPMQAQSPATTYNDVTRAVNTYTALNTPLAVQVDASEAARRARQEMNKGNLGSPVLVVQAPAKDHEAAHQKSGLGAFYVLWVATFLVLAAGLLYVAWQVIRLIMGNAFPRWQIGAG